MLDPGCPHPRAEGKTLLPGRHGPSSRERGWWSRVHTLPSGTNSHVCMHAHICTGVSRIRVHMHAHVRTLVIPLERQAHTFIHL